MVIKKIIFLMNTTQGSIFFLLSLTIFLNLMCNVNVFKEFQYIELNREMLKRAFLRVAKP